MAQDRWIPTGQQLAGGAMVRQLLHAGPDWQIFRIERDESVLVARASLAERWVRAGLVAEGLLENLEFGSEEFRAISSGPGHRLEPVATSGSPASKPDALSFAISLDQSRRIDPSAPFHDAIYVERYSRILPTWSISATLSEAEVLGRWLTGGVVIPATSLRRLASILTWLDESDVGDIVEAGGFGIGRESTSEKTGQPPDLTEPGSTAVSRTASATGADQGTASKSRPRAFRLPGRPELEAFFNEHVIDIIDNAEHYRNMGIEFPASIVLHGPPGCGKTFAIERLVEHLDWPSFVVESSTVGSPYIHETSRKVAVLFEEAIKAAPSMIIIDEMESFLSDRTLRESAGIHHVEEVGEFLRRIPEASKNQVLVVGMTNRLELLDAAILRRGRFDHIVEVGMPSSVEVGQLLESLFGKVPVKARLDTSEATEALTGRALSDTAFVVREAARLAAREGKSAIDAEGLRAALASLPPQEPKRRPIGFVHD